jgi:chemotaxis protein MotB
MEISDRDRAISEKNTRIATLESDLSKNKQQLEDVEAQLAQAIKESKWKDDAIRELQQNAERLKNRVGTTQQRNDELGSDLNRVLGDLQQKEKLWLKEKEGLSTITMPSAMTFGSGSTELTAEGKAVIDTIWSVLSRYPDRDIFIEGHTDSIPIGTGLRDRFPTNWELSAARATAVLRYVLSRHETEAGRLAAVGYGEFRPVATNSTEEGRTRNRRVVIAVRPRP